MLYVFVGLIVLGAIALALYAFLKKGELEDTVIALQDESQRQKVAQVTEIEGLKSELAKLEKIRHIPGVIDRAKKIEREIEAKLEQSKQQADGIVRAAREEAGRLEGEAREARRVADEQANGVLERARKEAKEIATSARKEAKEKTVKVEETLAAAIAYASEIRGKAEERAEEIAGKAYEARKRAEFYEAAAKAMENAASGYGGNYSIPSDHLLDELAEDYGFKRAGEKLKLARERTRIMEKEGVAATCNYPEGWKRNYAIDFVLGAFNGKVDSILARLKPANQAKLVQEIKDTFVLVNRNGEVFRNARIREEFLDARLDELKWGVAVQRIKDREREEQRAIREQIREEERARKEYEKASKQAQREEDLLARELEKARQEYEAAAGEDRAKYEADLRDLTKKLEAAEEKNRRAISMAQQTKCGHVYVISNIGSFGEDVYKIGLTRRLEPLDRVRELGDASVPFPFDVHAMIYSENAPALESALHQRFVQFQVNKVNRRKEFFRLKLQEVRAAIEEMKFEAKWTLAAEARDYRDTLAMEGQMRDDPEFRRRWAEDQVTYEATPRFDDEGDEAMQEDEAVALAEEN